MALTIVVSESPTAEQIAALGDGLNAHAVEQLDKDGFNPLAVFLNDYSGALVGGVSGYINWNWLQVRLLWVDSALRGGGYGKQLMTTIEREGRSRGCTRAHVDTFSYQARAFYQSLGYEEFARLEDYPPGHSRHYFQKELSP